MNLTIDTFKHLNEADPFSAAKMEDNRRYVELWMGYVPPPEASHREIVAHIAAARGESTVDVKKDLRVGEMLRRMPKLAESARRLHHLCSKRLRAIEGQVCAVTDPEKLSELDRRITDYLLPCAPNESLVQAPTITKAVRAMVIEIDEPAAMAPANLKRRTGSIRRGAEGFTRISFNVPDDEGVEVRAYFDKVVRSLHDGHGTHPSEEKDSPTLADALLHVVRTNAKVKVYHNIIESNGVLHLSGAGPLTSEEAERWRQAGRVRRLDAHASVKRYAIPQQMKTTVELLDGHCRFPGCDISADLCEKDHCEEYDQGGATSVENLYCLCKFHHTMKTERRVFYRVLGDRELEWHFRNGKTAITRPHGPAASRRFTSQSIAKATSNRTKRRRAQL